MKKKKPLVRVTTIEAFRRYIEQSDYDNFEITEQSVIDNIVGEFQGNQYTRVGTAFHAIVETGFSLVLSHLLVIEHSHTTAKRNKSQFQRGESLTSKVIR